MTEHPLTDEKCMSLFSFERLLDASQPITVEDSMRAAADWQLEEVIKWLENCSIRDAIFCGEDVLLEELKQAMRPQQQENN